MKPEQVCTFILANVVRSILFAEFVKRFSFLSPSLSASSFFLTNNLMVPVAVFKLNDIQKQKNKIEKEKKMGKKQFIEVLTPDRQRKLYYVSSLLPLVTQSLRRCLGQMYFISPELAELNLNAICKCDWLQFFFLFVSNGSDKYIIFVIRLFMVSFVHFA